MLPIRRQESSAKRCRAALSATHARGADSSQSIPTNIGLMMRDKASTRMPLAVCSSGWPICPGAERLVTCSPDVSLSTNLAGWINKTGAF
ncbi:MAG: hypothetical protein R2932_59470 [Caldilineaceae bacterium]